MKWVEGEVKIMQMSLKRVLEIHTFWDLSPFPIVYPPNSTTSHLPEEAPWNSLDELVH